MQYKYPIRTKNALRYKFQITCVYSHMSNLLFFCLVFYICTWMRAYKIFGIVRNSSLPSALTTQKLSSLVLLTLWTLLLNLNYSVARFREWKIKFPLKHTPSLRPTILNLSALRARDPLAPLHSVCELIIYIIALRRKYIEAYWAITALVTARSSALPFSRFC